MIRSKLCERIRDIRSDVLKRRESSADQEGLQRRDISFLFS
jgi:hypothetical protein